jgi:SGNH domain (fused to AT3 domains)
VLAVATAAGCAPTKKGAPSPRVLVVGDSVGASVQDALDFSFSARGWPFSRAAVLGCGVIEGVLSDLAGAPLPWAHSCVGSVWGLHDDRVERFRPSVVLWISYLEEWPRYLTDGKFVSPGEWQLPPPDGIYGRAADEVVLALIEQKRLQLTRHGAKLVFVTLPPPLTEHDVRAAHLNNLLKEFVLDHPADTALIDLAPRACPPTGQPPCPRVVDGIELRPDDVHFSSAGASWVANQIVPQL